MRHCESENKSKKKKVRVSMVETCFMAMTVKANQIQSKIIN